MDASYHKQNTRPNQEYEKLLNILFFSKNRQPSGHIFGSVYNSATSVCFCMQKPSGNCPDNSIIA